MDENKETENSGAKTVDGNIDDKLKSALVDVLSNIDLSGFDEYNDEEDNDEPSGLENGVSARTQDNPYLTHDEDVTKSSINVPSHSHDFDIAVHSIDEVDGSRTNSPVGYLLFEDGNFFLRDIADGKTVLVSESQVKDMLDNDQLDFRVPEKGREIREYFSVNLVPSQTCELSKEAPVPEKEHSPAKVSESSILDLKDPEWDTALTMLGVFICLALMFSMIIALDNVITDIVKTNSASIEETAQSADDVSSMRWNPADLVNPYASSAENSEISGILVVSSNGMFVEPVGNNLVQFVVETPNGEQYQVQTCLHSHSHPHKVSAGLYMKQTNNGCAFYELEDGEESHANIFIEKDSSGAIVSIFADLYITQDNMDYLIEFDNTHSNMNEPTSPAALEKISPEDAEDAESNKDNDDMGIKADE